jgi:uncharacterized small protein (DUF1192 family)
MHQLAEKPRMDDDVVKKPKAHEVGMMLDAMSVEELQQRIGLLEGEIGRLKAAIEARGHTHGQAIAKAQG